MPRYNVQKFKVFVCYKEKNGSLFAELIRNVLSRGNIESFVAHIERTKHVEVFDEIRQELFRHGIPFFIFIHTEDALSSDEVIKEFKMAFPNGKIEKTTLIILHHKNNSSRPTPKYFEEKTGLKLPSSLNIPSFKDEDSLIDLICRLAETYRITPNKLSKEYLLKELKLLKYIKECVSLNQTKNRLDNTILADIYIPNYLVLSKKNTWNVDDDKFSEYESKEWNVSDFLNSDNRIIVIGAPYGVGKTYFSYKLAADLAANVLAYFSSEIIPIYVPMRFGLQNIDNKGNSLEDILSLIPMNRKVLFIYDGLDEYSDSKDLQKLYKQIVSKLRKYSNSKVIITTRLNASFPDILNIDIYARMMPFNNSQIDLFLQKYGVPLRSSQILQSGLGLNEIGKPLFLQYDSYSLQAKE